LLRLSICVPLAKVFSVEQLSERKIFNCNVLGCDFYSSYVDQ